MAIKLLIKKDNILLFFLCIIVGVSIVATNNTSSFRYVKYLIPFCFSIFLVLNPRNVKVNKIAVKNLILLSILILINLIYSTFQHNITIRFFEEALLMLLPVLSVLIVSAVIRLPINKILNALFLVYALIFIIGNFKFFFNLSFILDFIAALKTSNLETESWMAFPFGLFTMYFILENKYKWAIVSVILFLFAFKRISIIAVLFSLILFWFLYKRKAYRFKASKAILWFVVLNITLLFILYNFIQGNFDGLIKEFTGLSPNHFTQGRLRIYTDSINHFKDNFLFGNGLGATNLFLLDNFEQIHFLHSDILKLIIELGFVSYLIWMIYFFKINLVNNKAVPVLIFMNILFLSDNVFIYFDTLFIFYLLIIYYSNNETKRDTV